MEVCLITPESLAVLGYLIPKEYQEEITAGRLMGIVIVNTAMDGEIFGVMLFRERNNWMEIVWVCLDPLYRGTEFLAPLIRHSVKVARKDGKVWGAFANLPSGGRLEEILKKAFLEEGFTLVPVVHRCYVATLGIVKESPIFERMLREKAGQNVISLGQANESMKKRLAAAVQDSPEPVPLPIPIDFSAYEQRLSCIHCKDAVTPDAFMFVTDKGGHLTIECAWTETPNALLALLSGVFREAQKYYSDDTEVFVPAVTDISAKLAEKMIPGAKPIEGLQARLLFSEEREENLWQEMEM